MISTVCKVGENGFETLPAGLPVAKVEVVQLTIAAALDEHYGSRRDLMAEMARFICVGETEGRFIFSDGSEVSL